MNDEPQRDLIFDFGVHRGLDSGFYLAKGFRVVGIEAVPELCQMARESLASFGKQLTVINKALSESVGHATFYMNPAKDDWGSLDKAAAEKGMANARPIEVETITLAALFETYGVPYYIKCDLEGGDIIFRNQLRADHRRPVFVSLEANTADDLDVVAACGYDRVQIVNQFMHWNTVPPSPSREGTFVDARFNGHTSGLFGRELDPARWISIAEAKERYLAWVSLHERDDLLAPGWLDLHFCRSSALTGP